MSPGFRFTHCWGPECMQGPNIDQPKAWRFCARKKRRGNSARETWLLFVLPTPFHSWVVGMMQGPQQDWVSVALPVLVSDDIVDESVASEEDEDEEEGLEVSCFVTKLAVVSVVAVGVEIET
ncbi:hypothetical protein LTR66_008821 [Elasticomyces elasticus]|nr:hypothetical protein LTR66_008821 [Elasticomyces elasticus]